jgi:carboxyl-terminal processing protease
VNGQFVEETPDTNETDATKKARPAFKSDAGRVVYGGGGITPDVIVQDDTLTTAEQQFAKSVAPKIQEFFTIRDDYALELSKTVKLDFQVQPAWMDEFYKRIEAKGITNDRKAYDAASRYVSRLLDLRVSHFAFGDSTAKRRDLKYDAPAEESPFHDREGRLAAGLVRPGRRAARRRCDRSRRSLKFGHAITHFSRRHDRGGGSCLRPQRDDGSPEPRALRSPQTPASVISPTSSSSPSPVRTPSRISATTASA